jgi:hypothetical protein
LPDKLVIFGGGIAPLSAKLDPFFSILNRVDIVTMQLLKVFDDNLLCLGLNLVAVIRESVSQLYN